MKKAILLIFVFFLSILSINTYAYKYQNESGNGLSLYQDFTNGGIQEKQGDFNTSTIIGNTLLRPFNESGIEYSIYEGLVYIIWSNIIIEDVVTPAALNISCTVIHKEIEWGEINCTSQDTVNWSFSIKDKLSNEIYVTLDDREIGLRKFVGLEAGRPYIVEINATTSSLQNTSSIEFRTKTGKENMEISMVIGMGLIVIIFLVLTIVSATIKPFLANFFFLGIFIFTTILTGMIHKITVVNQLDYEPIAFIAYRMILIITMLMIFIVLLLLTIEAVKLRKIEGNPIDTYRDNLGKDEKDKF